MPALDSFCFIKVQRSNDLSGAGVVKDFFFFGGKLSPSSKNACESRSFTFIHCFGMHKKKREEKERNET